MLFLHPVEIISWLFCLLVDHPAGRGWIKSRQGQVPVGVQGGGFSRLLSR